MWSTASIQRFALHSIDTDMQLAKSVRLAIEHASNGFNRSIFSTFLILYMLDFHFLNDHWPDGVKQFHK